MYNPFNRPFKLGLLASIILALLFVYSTSPGRLPTAIARDEAMTSSVTTPEGWPEDAQSTTGPVPPQDVSKFELLAPQEEVILLDVPAYLWRRGCGPTAAGMVLGYWDGHGFDNLVPGSAATQTTEVDEMISSAGNYNDYCLPIDSYPILLPDLSELPFGDEHADDSVADFMETSQSYFYNYYGWSWYSDMDDALEEYAQLVAPGYSVTAENRIWGSFTWDGFKAEIDAGRPVVLLVDTNADGSTDHFVTAMGYSDESGTKMYACRNTWDSNIHWFEFAPMSSGQSWGIYGATLFQIITSPTSPEMDVRGNGQSIADGDSTPSPNDHTDFGSTLVSGGTALRTFTIVNDGTADLILSGVPKVVVGGANPSDFTVSLQPTSPVSPGGGSTTFTVTFDPSAEGLRTATISIENNDANENPYNFSIQGNGAISLKYIYLPQFVRN